MVESLDTMQGPVSDVESVHLVSSHLISRRDAVTVNTTHLDVSDTRQQHDTWSRTSGLRAGLLPRWHVVTITAGLGMRGGSVVLYGLYGWDT